MKDGGQEEKWGIDGKWKEKKKRTARVAVIGLAGQSAFMTAEHFPVPGETIACEALFFELGGKGYNQAIACARMGAETVFIGAVGADINGRECRCELEREGIIPCLVEKEEPTAYAVITTRTDSENTVAVCSGAAKALCGEDLRAESVFREIEKSDYILLQNELSQECLESAFALAQELGIPVIFNPAPAHHIPPELLVKSAVVTPNYGEAKELMGYRPEDEYEMDEETGKQLHTFHSAYVAMRYEKSAVRPYEHLNGAEVKDIKVRTPEGDYGMTSSEMEEFIAILNGVSHYGRARYYGSSMDADAMFVLEYTDGRKVISE